MPKSKVPKLPCVCDNKNCPGLILPEFCEFVFYHPQDIKKAEKLAGLAGFKGFAMAYKKCDACKWE